MEPKKVKTTITLTLGEVLSFGQKYEYFEDLLRETACDVMELDTFDYVVCYYAAIACPEPNVIRFEVELLEDK